MKKSVLSTLLALVIVINLLPVTVLAAGAGGSDGPAPLRKENVELTFRRDLDNAPATLGGLTYDENWFFGDSYDYNADLAEMSMGLVLSGYDDSSNYDTVGKTGDSYVKALYQTLGFPGDSYYSVGYDREDNETIAMAMASKDITKDGQEITLLAIDLRSGGYGDGGWKGNFNVGEGVKDEHGADNSKYHLGFYNAGSFAVSEIEKYISAHGLDVSKTRFWIVGYSRGAATANIASILLGEKENIDRTNIFTYAGATPAYVMNAPADASLNNIFNLINSGDIVTMVPPKSWGFGILGTTVPLNPLTEDNRFDFEGLFYDVAGTSYYGLLDYTEIGTALFNLLTGKFATRQVYAQQLQAVAQSLFNRDEAGKTDFSYIDNILTCEGTENGFSVESIKASFTGIDTENPYALIPAVGMLGEGLEAAIAYWQTVEGSYNDELLQNVYDLINEVLGIVMSGDTSGNLMLDTVKETITNGIASPLAFQHWPELYVARMRAKNNDELLTVTFDANGGSVATDTAKAYSNGRLPALPVPTRDGGYSFIGWYLDDVPVTLTTVFTVDSTITAKWTYIVPDSYTPPTVTVPVSSDAGKTVVSATVSGKTAGVTVSDEQLEAVIVSAGNTGTVSVDVSGVSDITGARLPAKIVNAAVGTGSAAGLAVKLPTGSVTLDKAAAEAVNKGLDVTFSVENIKTADLTDSQKKALGDKLDSALVVDVNVLVNGEKISDFNGGKITVSIPYAPGAGEDISRLTVWYVRADGSIENVGGRYDAVKKCFVFETTHLSRYILVSAGNAALPFTDVSENDWFRDDVAYAYKTGLFEGVSDTAFSPRAAMTRGMVVTVLWRMEGRPAATRAMSFTDVASDGYYRSAIEWAAENKLAEGYSAESFGPEDSITREQLAAILYRYARYKGMDVSAGEDTSILSYTDAGSVSEYALPAMQWAVAAGLIRGDAGNLMPRGSAERCQVAALLHRFCGNGVK